MGAGSLEANRDHCGGAGLQSRIAVRIAATACFYIMAAVTMVILNKQALTLVPAPVTLLWLQTLVCCALIWALNITGYVGAPKPQWNKAARLMPMIGTSLLMLTLNTYCMQYVDISMFQIARGLLLPCTIIMERGVFAKPISARLLPAVILIVSGFLCGVTESHPQSPSSDEGRSERHFLGMLFGFASSVAGAGNACLVKTGLSVVNGDSIALSYYQQTLLALALIPAVLISGELHIIQSVLSDRDLLYKYARIIMATGVLASCINVAGFLQIKLTSPTTHIVAGCIRGVVQTGVAFIVFGDTITINRAFGIPLIIAGTSWYTYVTK